MKTKSDEVGFVGLRMPSEMKEKLEEIAALEERNLSQQIIYFLKLSMDDYWKKKLSQTHQKQHSSGKK